MNNSFLIQEHINRVVGVRHDTGKLLIDNGQGNVIKKSWLRCLDEHYLQPGDKRPAEVLSRHEMTERNDRMGEFLSVAKLGMEDLYGLVSPMDCILLLTDTEGVTVDHMVDRRFEKDFKQAGLHRGAIWNEAHAGTTAVGVCLETKEPVICHRKEHFFTKFIGLSCTAAPIFDPFDNLIAIIDISSLYSFPAKESQNLALQLMLLYARKIESANFLAQFANHWIIRFGNSNQFVDVIADNLIALDGNGVVIGATQAAAKSLKTTVSAMLGHSILNCFDCTLEMLFSASWENHRLRLAAHESKSFTFLGEFVVDITRQSIKTIRCQGHNPSVASNPEARVASDVTPSGENDYPPKIKLMVETLRSNKWGITDTAKELNISRSTIYRRIKKFGILSPNKRAS